MNGELAGYLAALSAVFFYGTNYVPAKQYQTYDGIIFQWFMCSGILMVGLAWGLFSNNWVEYSKGGLYTFPEGILGGSLFAMANLLIPTVVNNLGLGIGFMVWNATNIFLGYIISRFGLFGVNPTIPSHPWISALGIGFMLASIYVYGKIETTLAPPKKTSHEKPNENAPLLPGGVLKPSILLYRDSLEEESLHEALMHPELPNFGPFLMSADVSEHVTLYDKTAEKTRKFIGVLLALVVGAFLSCCLVPYVNWQQDCHPSVVGTVVIENCNPLDFVFSQCLGIYITSTIVFLLYSLFSRYIVHRSMPRSVMRPSYMCGILWAFGLASQLFSMGKLGFDQVYPLSSIGPAMVSMLWSAMYFKEIQGKRNIQILIVATSMVLIGTVLRVVSA